jgi:cytochrome d ubiquinol oxidase subunit I
MMKLVAKGPKPHHEHAPAGHSGQVITPRRPLSADAEILETDARVN